MLSRRWHFHQQVHKKGKGDAEVGDEGTPSCIWPLSMRGFDPGRMEAGDAIVAGAEGRSFLRHEAPSMFMVVRPIVQPGERVSSLGRGWSSLSKERREGVHFAVSLSEGVLTVCYA